MNVGMTYEAFVRYILELFRQANDMNELAADAVYFAPGPADGGRPDGHHQG